ncbi:SDR family oxidoreductase, partial [Klebsiella aerogenes]
APMPGGSYLVLAHQNDDLGENTAKRLRERGIDCTVNDFGQLSGAPLADNIICCLGNPEGDGAQESWAPLSYGLAVLRHLEQQKASARLWWVTRKAVALSADSVCDPDQYAAWGAGRTLLHEYPDTYCTLIDLGQGADADALARAVTRDDGEREMVLTAEGRYVPRLEVVKNTGDSRVFSQPGTVLISGGLGAVGLRIASCLADTGVAHLLLTGRRGMETPGAPEAVAALEQKGAKVTVVAADIADPRVVAQLLASVPPALPLQGVVHAAGVLDDAILLDHDDVRLANLFRAKVQGARNLDVQTRGLPLDFFVLFSSIAGTLGSAGQGGYAAANACLDAIASNRRRLGLAGQSLAWGLWTDGDERALGLASGLDAAQRARLQKTGIGVITPELGERLFVRALGHDGDNLLLAPI